MTKAQEKVLEIGKYIQKKDGKITKNTTKDTNKRKTARKDGLDFLHPYGYNK